MSVDKQVPPPEVQYLTDGKATVYVVHPVKGRYAIWLDPTGKTEDQLIKEAVAKVYR